MLCIIPHKFHWKFYRSFSAEQTETFWAWPLPAHLNTPTQSAMQHGLCSSPCYVTALAQIKQLPVQAVHTEQACCSHGFCILKRPVAMPLLAAIICMAGGCCRLTPRPSPPSAGAAHAHATVMCVVTPHAAHVRSRAPHVPLPAVMHILCHAACQHTCCLGAALLQRTSPHKLDTAHAHAAVMLPMLQSYPHAVCCLLTVLWWGSPHCQTPQAPLLTGRSPCCACCAEPPPPPGSC